MFLRTHISHISWILVFGGGHFEKVHFEPFKVKIQLANHQKWI
jgi:hypothetical protein